jgi:Cu-Zn family superoxide dismutase
MKYLWIGGAFLVAVSAQAASAQTVDVKAISTQGVGKPLGTLTLSEVDGGVSFAPKLSGFAPGKHAFHVHQKPDCGPAMSNGRPVAGLAAGPHYAGPPSAMAGHGDMNMQHGMAMAMAGDLPELVADSSGAITGAVTKKGLTLDELHGRSVMIHQYGEKPDDPKHPAGGGARIACAVLP